MKPTDRKFELVYSQEEMESKVEEMKMRGYSEHDIHVLVTDGDILNSRDINSDLQTHEASSFGSKFKSFFTGDDAVKNELRNLELDEHTINMYQKDLENGAILLYTDHQSMEENNVSSFGDDTRVVDSDEEKRNTAFAPFGRDIERDGMKFNDEKIKDPDVKADLNEQHKQNGEIYTTEVPREEQYGLPGYGDKPKDSRVKGENIHPTTGDENLDESSVREKQMDHEPNLETDEDNLNREDGVNRRQDEQSPGIDPNLGPAPFGRDSEEEHLLNDRRDDFEQQQDPKDARQLHKDAEKRTGTPPTPRLF